MALLDIIVFLYRGIMIVVVVQDASMLNFGIKHVKHIDSYTIVYVSCYKLSDLMSLAQVGM